MQAEIRGNCGHVEFVLTKEERAFLTNVVNANSLDVIWGSWIPQKGNVKKVGASRQLDPEKLRFVKNVDDAHMLLPT